MIHLLTATHRGSSCSSGRDAVEAFGFGNDAHGSEESAATQGELLEKCTTDLPPKWWF